VKLVANPISDREIFPILFQMSKRKITQFLKFAMKFHTHFSKEYVKIARKYM
jgi:hypothetical protein